MKTVSVLALALTALINANGALSDRFQSFTATNRNPNKATAIFASFIGVIPLEYGQSHTFSGDRGYNVAVEGSVLYDVLLTSERLEIVAREGFNPEKYDIVFSLAHTPQSVEL